MSPPKAQHSKGPRTDTVRGPFAVRRDGPDAVASGGREGVTQALRGATVWFAGLMTGKHDVIAGRYVVVERIGVGGMGHVWRAHDERLDREVAVKLLHTQPDGAAGVGELGYERAMREGRITARLHHPHAVPVFDVVEHEGQPCLVMQYFPSRSLAEHLAEHGRMPAAEVAKIGSEVASALAAAHRAGIVHRDVKPANVLIGPDGTTKITDFGIAHAIWDASLTTTGMVTGTPAYLSPEVARGGRASSSSDVFSLGSTLYAALEGRPPFGTSENSMALLHLVASGDVVPPQHAGALTPLLLRMLSADPEGRPSADEVSLALSGPVEDLAGLLAPTVVSSAPTDPTERVRSDDRDDSRQPAPATDAGPTRVQHRPASPSSPPPSPDSAPPPAPAPAGRQAGTRGRNRAVLAVLALAAAGVALAIALQGEEPGSTATRERSPSASSSSTAPSTEAAPSSEPAPSSAAPDPPSSTAPASPAPTRSASSPAGSADPSATQLAGAVADYYAMLPGDLDTAWGLLTERYQNGTAGSRETFGSFWGAVDQVRASDVSGSPPGEVTATITYEYDDGRVFVERTSYELVADDGVLKIDGSRVLSSEQR